MTESDHRHLDAAQDRWEREESRVRKWSILLRLLPYAVVALLLLLAFIVFE
jgi:hypothetical protein